jgi:glycosyltransferase involved in cell wall biosynthesis
MSWRDLANEQAGGSEVFIDRLAVRLMGMGHEVMHLCGGPVGRRPYRVVETGGTYSQYLRAPVVHHRLARHWDLLVDTENGLPFFSPLWRRGAVLAMVYHVHRDQWSQRFPAPIAAVGRFTESRLMPLAYRRVPFVALSESTAESLAAIGVARSRIDVLEVGVDPPSTTIGARAAEPMFVCLGRLVPHKRVDLLLRAWDRVRPAVGGTLLVVGDGPERATLESQAGPGVEFTGRVDEDEKWRLLGSAWALVHPAQHEGWGIAIVEAAEVGTPAIGFDVPGVRDAIVEQVTGLLVRSEDELVQQWVSLAEDRTLRERLSEGARRHSANFDWDEVTAKFAAIAERVVGAHARLAS